jgi:predicted small lipoprotein YifL
MRFAVILFALALTLQGCGIRGPLYLPQKPAATPAQAQPAATPAEQPDEQEKK